MPIMGPARAQGIYGRRKEQRPDGEDAAVTVVPHMQARIFPWPPKKPRESNDGDSATTSTGPPVKCAPL